MFTSKSLAAAEIDAFRLEDLEAMSSDCGRIFLRLGFIEEPSKKQAMEESLLKFLFRPWSYTPPQRGSRKKQRRKAQKELPLQQPSSEG